MKTNYWDGRIEYLLKTRQFMWNVDYVEFLIKNVWRLEGGLDVVDFGCGIGYLSNFLLPILDTESTYTGLDLGEELIAKAKEIHSGNNRVFFHQTDLSEYIPQRKYDVAICQTFLGLIPDGYKILEKMRDSVKPGGKVLCIEPDGNMANAGVYLDGIDRNDLINYGVTQKYWQKNKKAYQTDGCIGMKIPVYMQKLGMKNISVRVNDCVQFANIDSSSHKDDLDYLLAYGCYDMKDIKLKKKLMIRSGVDKADVERQAEAEIKISDFIENNKSHLMAVQVPAFIISCATVIS